ncbi:MAG: IS3 family transposase [Ruminococcus sp.]|nr:IS3 family transposase [Ruminococcus sp.]
MPQQVKFEIIKSATERDNNLLSINKMCSIAGVSRSGYYNWLNSADKRAERENRDKADFELVLEAYRFRGYKKGARSIYMRLLHKDILMNLKKIRRLMRKYGLKCPIRGANPYRRMAKALKTSNVAPNIVKRDFFSRGARKVLLTDITYLFYKGGVCYLSPILDAFTREILAYELSDNLRVDFVLQTVDEMIAKHGCTLDDTTIVHSDQGCHYTSLAFIKKLKESGLTQSMSRKGNCWDNAPQESFFGHMKDEIKSEIAACDTFDQVKAIVDDWMDYYNNDRYQWDLAKLSPKEYYEYVTTGIYPLQKYQGFRGAAPNPEV